MILYTHKVYVRRKKTKSQTQKKYSPMIKKNQTKPAKKQKLRRISPLEETLSFQLKVNKIYFEREVRFHASRKWQFDFVVQPKIAIECEGGIHCNGRHTRAYGFEADIEKYNEATILGWSVLRFTKRQIDQLIAIDTIKKIIKIKSECACLPA